MFYLPILVLPHQGDAATRLEASLLQMISDHNHTSLQLRERTEKAKKEAIQMAMRVSELLVDAVNRGVQEVFLKEKPIEMEIRSLAAAVLRFSKQTDQCLTASHAINTAVKMAMRVSELLVDAVNGGVQEVFPNEKRIEMEIRSLATVVLRFSKQTDQWLTTSHAINTAVKEIGDFENWMKTMELDCKSISTAICNIHQA